MSVFRRNILPPSSEYSIKDEEVDRLYRGMWKNEPGNTGQSKPCERKGRWTPVWVKKQEAGKRPYEDDQRRLRGQEKRNSYCRLEKIKNLRGLSGLQRYNLHMKFHENL